MTNYFQGSIVRLLSDRGPLSAAEISFYLGSTSRKVSQHCRILVKEGFLFKHERSYFKGQDIPAIYGVRF
jgi:predicted transcriptional regulator